MVNLDRFAQGLPDMQDVAPLETCQACGGDIYPGEDVYFVNGYVIHAELECLMEFAGAVAMTIEAAMTIEGAMGVEE